MTHFDQYLTKCSALFRLNYYPPCPEPEKTVRLTAHTDYNLLTVLHQGEIGGLQVEKDGQWIALRPREGAFAINVGDTLQVLVFIYFKNPFHMREQFFFNPSTTTTRSNAKIFFITSLNFLELIYCCPIMLVLKRRLNCNCMMCFYNFYSPKQL
jgi:hypothetical protein